MKKVAIVIGLMLLATTWAFSADSWTGYVSDSNCKAKGNGPGHAACAEKCIGKGAQAVLVTDGDNNVVNIANQDKVKGHAGHHVKVTGKLDGDTLTVDTVSMVEEKEKGKKKKG